MRPSSAGLGPTVQPKIPGEILGFDLDQNGNDGVFANYRDLSDGLTVVSVETFDQRSGKITKVVHKGKSPNASYAVYAIINKDVAILEDGHKYRLMNPVTGEKLGGYWNPPVPFYLSEVAVNQTTSRTLMLGYDASYPTEPTALLVGNVLHGKMKVIALDQSVFGTGDVPTVAQDYASNQGMVTGGNGAPYTHPAIGIVDLATGTTDKFTGLGYGSINSIAIDPKTDTACTVTNLDEGIEFYNIGTKVGFERFLPNQGSQLQSGSQVAIDPIHGLCIATQPVSIGQGTQQSAVWVFDEQGNEIEGIQGFNFWFGAGLSIDPAHRRGYVLNPRPNYSTLTGFTY